MTRIESQEECSALLIHDDNLTLGPCDIINITSKIFVTTGIVAASFSYAAHIVAPAAALTIIGVPTFLSNSLTEPADHSDAAATAVAANALFRAALLGGFAAGVTAYYTWHPLINFVHTSPMAKLGGIIGASLIAVGGTFWLASSCANSRK